MTDVVRVFLSECARRKVEPYYGFVESVHIGEIHCDLDFAPIAALRLMVHALNAAAPPGSSSSAKGRVVVHGDDASMILTKLSLQLGVNRNKLHPPMQSNTLVSYAKLASRYEPNHPDVLFRNCGALLGGGSGVAAASGTTAASAVTRLLSGYAACVRAHGATLHTIRLRGVQLCQSSTRPRAQEMHFKKTPSPDGGKRTTLSTPVASLGVSRLAAALPYALKLAVLDLTDANVGDVNAIRILSSIAQLPFLREVYLAGCALTDASADALVMLVQCSVAKQSTATFKTALRSGGGSGSAPSSVGLSVLGLSRNAVGDRFLILLSEALKHDASLHSLLYDHNAPTTKGLLRLLSGLTDAAASGTSVLSFIDLSGNGGVDVDALLAPLDTLSLTAGFVVSTGHGGSEHQFTISRDVVASSAKVILGGGGGARTTRRLAETEIGPSNRPYVHHNHHHDSGYNETAVRPSSNRPAAAASSQIYRGDDRTQGSQPEPRQRRTTTSAGRHPAQRHRDQYGDVDAHDEGDGCAYRPMTPPQPASPASTVQSRHGRSPSSRSPRRSQERPTGSAPPQTSSAPQPSDKKGTDDVANNEAPAAGEATMKPVCSTPPPALPVTVDDLLLDVEESVLQPTPEPQDQGAVLMDDCDGVLDPRPAPPPADTQAPLHVMQQMLEIHEEATRLQVEGVRSDLAATNHRVEDLASTMHTALSTVQATALELERERRVFQEAEAIRADWMASHPEEAIERDVVELIQAGIERIRHHMSTDDSPPPKGRSSAAPFAAASSSSSTRGGPPPPMTTNTKSAQLGMATTWTGQAVSNKASMVSAASIGGGDTFLSDVKRKLSSLGW